MRSITMFWIFLIFLATWIISVGYGFISSETSGLWFLFAFLPLIILTQFPYFNNQPFGYALWVNHVLVLFKIFSQLDNQHSVKENKIVLNYLEDEFDSFTVGIKYQYFLTKPKETLDLDKACSYIRMRTTSHQKLKIIHRLIKITLADRLMSDNERAFLIKVSRKIGIHQKTVKAILNLHTFVTEQDIKNQQFSKPRVNHGLQRAYSLLGLESTASFEEVKSAYRELVKIYHPDKQRGSKKSLELAKNKFQAISNAYELIKDFLN